MTDMLVKLWDLPNVDAEIESLATQGIRIVQALAHDRRHVLRFVEEHFPANPGWLDECDSCLVRHPVTCFLAVKRSEPDQPGPRDKVIGFSCYDGSAKGFFGPLGIDEAFRQRGVGRVLVVRTMNEMRHAGYGYAVVGWANSVSYYQNAVGAIPIADSRPGFYERMIEAD